MKKKIYFYLLLLFLITNNSYSDSSVYIQVTVNDKIITNHDIKKEETYLKVLNPQLSNLDEKKRLSIAKNSLINEIIKKSELKRVFDLEKKLPLINDVFQDFYKRLNFNSEEAFKKSLSQNNYSISKIKNKLKIEILWNRLIVRKYKNQVKINKKKLLKKINENKNKIKSEFLLSEIFFSKKKDESLDKTIKEIKKSIREIGFSNTANIYSISASANFGGNIGWIEQDNLSRKIFKELDKISKGQNTDIIQVGNEFLILKIEDKKSKEVTINTELKLNEMINFETNKQLNQFSNIHFNKVKINYAINEK
jgi:peptidyl-prolyl cis-trans isomerase SurA